MNENYYEYTIRINSEVADILLSKLEDLGALSIFTVDSHEIETEIIPMLEQDKTNVFDDFGLFSVGQDFDQAVIKAYFLEVKDNKVAVNLYMGVGEIFRNENNVVFTTNNIPKGKLSPELMTKRIVAEIDFISGFFEDLRYDVSYNLIKAEQIEELNKVSAEIFQLTDRILVNPSTEDLDFSEQENQKLINIIPSSAYGSGRDETTSLAAKTLDDLLQKLEKNQDLRSLEVLDLGTGSGILAIIAAKLGVRSIKAVDIDRDAIKIAKDTAKLNEVSEFIDFANEELVNQDKYDLILANLSSELIINLAKDFPKHLKSESYLILAGINQLELEDVLAEFRRIRNANFKILKTSELNQWVTLLLSYKA